MIIETGNLTRGALDGKAAVISGAGGGIGFEAARALLWLGCKVIIAEMNAESGRRAAEKLNQEFEGQLAFFVRTDVGSEASVRRLARQAEQLCGHLDIVINNATIAPIGAVADVDIKTWDASYRVNLRGPVLLARAFLPAMRERDWGVFICVSSTGGGYMGAYESLKAAQIHLANTLNEELENTNVSAFTIGPGFVPTQTAASSIPKLAALMGKSMEAMQGVLKAHTLSIEAAGAGFAAAVCRASDYRGQEISSIQALLDAGIDVDIAQGAAGGISLDSGQCEQALSLCRSIRETLSEQSAGWQERSTFERQWIIRSFRQKASMPVDNWLARLEQLETVLQQGDMSTLVALYLPLDRLASYYAYLHDMAKGYVKDPVEREEQLGIVKGWQGEVEMLHALLNEE